MPLTKDTYKIQGFIDHETKGMGKPYKTKYGKKPDILQTVDRQSKKHYQRESITRK